MKDHIRAALLSGLVLPGLGQVVNRQILKGLGLMGLITVIFVAILIKLLIDLSAVMTQVVGPDLVMGPDTLSKIIEGLRQRNAGPLLFLGVFGAVVWAYGLVDAFLIGRRIMRSNVEGN